MFEKQFTLFRFLFIIDNNEQSGIVIPERSPYEIDQ